MSETSCIYNPNAVAIPAPSEWAAMKDMAEQLHKSGFMPDSIQTPMQALAVIQQGRELGLPPMFSLRNIFVIGGKPALNAQAIAAIIKQRVHPDAITVEETTDDHCAVSYWRPSWKQRRQFTFSLADAKRAGLLDGNNAHTWRKYPRNMLQARAISGVGIMEYQDVLGGIYIPEELGAAVDMDATGALSVTLSDRLRAAITPHESEPDAHKDIERERPTTAEQPAPIPTDPLTGKPYTRERLVLMLSTRANQLAKAALTYPAWGKTLAEANDADIVERISALTTIWSESQKTQAAANAEASDREAQP